MGVLAGLVYANPSHPGELKSILKALQIEPGDGLAQVVQEIFWDGLESGSHSCLSVIALPEVVPMGLCAHPARSQSRLLEFVQTMWFISTQLVLSTEPATEIWGIARCDGTYLHNAEELEDWRQELPTNQRVISGTRSTRHGLRLRQRPWRVWAHLWWAVRHFHGMFSASSTRFFHSNSQRAECEQRVGHLQHG